MPAPAQITGLSSHHFGATQTSLPALFHLPPTVPSQNLGPTYGHPAADEVHKWMAGVSLIRSVLTAVSRAGITIPGENLVRSVITCGPKGSAAGRSLSAKEGLEATYDTHPLSDSSKQF